MRDNLAQVKPNQVIYTVFVRESENAPLEELGNLILDDHFVASAFGDKDLFFGHANRK